MKFLINRGFTLGFVPSLFLWWGVASPTPNPQAEGSPPVDCPRLLIQYIRTTLHIWRVSPPSATCARAMPSWQGTHLTWNLTP
jgi:hypothetical protein